MVVRKISMQTHFLIELNRPLSGGTVAFLYVGLSLTDMILSQAAFVLGIPEGNPFLAWLLPRGLFILGKLILTALVGILIAALHTHKKVRFIAAAAVIIMAVVDLYHIWWLNVFLQEPAL